MKHFGIWVIKANSWLVNGMGDIFWTTSRAVAEAQLARFNRPAEIREFIDTPEP
jgi:hypothetical protein